MKETVYVLLRFSKKTGEIDTCMTGIVKSMFSMWALCNTPETKHTLVFNRDTGDCIFDAEGSADNGPVINKFTGKTVTCKDYGIPLETLHKITDDRFDE